MRRRQSRKRNRSLPISQPNPLYQPTGKIATRVGRFAFHPAPYPVVCPLGSHFSSSTCVSQYPTCLSPCPPWTRPSKAEPTRTASIAAPEKCSTPEELRICAIPGSMPASRSAASTRLNDSICAFVAFLSQNAECRCV